MQESHERVGSQQGGPAVVNRELVAEALLAVADGASEIAELAKRFSEVVVLGNNLAERVVPYAYDRKQSKRCGHPIVKAWVRAANRAVRPARDWIDRIIQLLDQKAA